MKRILIFLTLLLVFAPVSISAVPLKHHYVIKLKHGYTLVVDEPPFDEVDYDSLISSLRLLKDGKTIFSDTNEYYSWEKDELYSLVLHFGLDHDEILLKYYDRLSTKEVLRLFIKGSSVVKVDTLPSFWGPSDFARDGKPRFAAFWDYGKWDDSGGWMPYQPILFYIVTREGLKFDSTQTNTINKRIYGKYYGYDDSEQNLLFPVSVYRPLKREWKRVRNARKISLHGF